MTKKGDDIGNTILAALAIIGGGLIFSEIVKAVSKKVTVYTCPNCKYDKIVYGTAECPNCRAHLTWGNQTQKI